MINPLTHQREVATDQYISWMTDLIYLAWLIRSKEPDLTQQGARLDPHPTTQELTIKEQQKKENPSDKLKSDVQQGSRRELNKQGDVKITFSRSIISVM